MANPIISYVNTYLMTKYVDSDTDYVTFYFDITNNFEAYVPITICHPNTANWSYGAEIHVYRTTDNGGSWETESSVAHIFPAAVAALEIQRKDVYLTTGKYLIKVVPPNKGITNYTLSINLGTAFVVTAYI